MMPPRLRHRSGVSALQAVDDHSQGAGTIQDICQRFSRLGRRRDADQGAVAGHGQLGPYAVQHGEVGTCQADAFDGVSLQEQLAEYSLPGSVGVGWIASPHDRWVSLAVPGAACRGDVSTDAVAQPTHNQAAALQ